jgi:hypothetical protein
MITRNYKAFTLLTLTAALLLGACAGQMEPAQRALASIDSAIASATVDAGKYVPDQLAAVQGKAADLKSAFERKDYKAVLAGAPAVLSEAQGLLATAALKKEEIVKALSTEWTALAVSLPQLVGAVKNRVDTLSKTRKPPAGVDLAAAKAGLADATTQWGKAQAAFSAGHVEEAVAAAKDVKAKAEAAAEALQLKLTAVKPAA